MLVCSVVGVIDLAVCKQINLIMFENNQIISAILDLRMIIPLFQSGLGIDIYLITLQLHVSGGWWDIGTIGGRLLTMPSRSLNLIRDTFSGFVYSYLVWKKLLSVTDVRL